MPSAKCTYCGNIQDIAENYAEKLATCSACNHKFPVRRVDEQPSKSAQFVPPKPEPQPAAKPDTPKPAVNAGKVKITCPHCQFSSEVPAGKIPPEFYSSIAASAHTSFNSTVAQSNNPKSSIRYLPARPLCKNQHDRNKNSCGLWESCFLTAGRISSNAS
jgi:hypothetical protein